jgi:DNA polymerase III subunit gamma/tau
MNRHFQHVGQQIRTETMTNLARKYRPTQLTDLLGQQALVNVMTAAIEHDRLAQSYILTGVRGVGKTTTARIIARSVNCENGPTITPCGTCQSCREIDTDSSMDVYELDAASRNGVADMRELIENISYAPMRRGARKIYILDEAHMLSTAAWNALLKTLEEPPAHVIFIFATTEPRKIPATIQSRCQKFSLRRIEIDTIAKHMSNVAASETMELEDGVEMLIAQAGEGSMRDALSILDQAISGAADKTVALQDVRDMIGKASPSAMIDVLSAVLEGVPADAISAWRKVLDAGVDPISALDDLMVLLHQTSLAGIDLMLLRESGLAKPDAKRLCDIAGKVPMAYITAAQKMLFETRAAAAANPSRAQAAEILVLRLTAGFARKK